MFLRPLLPRSTRLIWTNVSNLKFLFLGCPVMNLDEFHKEILENVAAQAAASEEFRHSAFVEHSLRLLEDAEEVADVQPCFYRGTGSKNRNSGVDAYSLD